MAMNSSATEEMKVDLIDESIKPYLHEITERLWSGHAAIMVGAGFSKNAKSSGATGASFPNWEQLGDLFYEKINNASPTNSKYLNILKLADEVQAAIGRPALDQLLRSNIPDKEYEPSELHIKLLELPWVDIYTTNYDTLLERASSSITSQKYDIVINKEDLVYSEKPRIIKLHGSFPSERPFIITEEDYRLYPKKFAPFVNTVQQALLENTLCLIGFSGDDPNFLQWTGWIRDNLGTQNSPKIYLVGLFTLSDAQKKLLEQRNIVLVDLAQCPGVKGDHYKALERFINYLLSKKEDDNRLGWPSSNGGMSPDSKKPDKFAQLTNIIGDWKKNRFKYPNWVILPEDRRSLLWIFTERWMNFLLPKDDIPVPFDIEFAFELNWRLEKSLVPISNDLAKLYEKILQKYSPFNEIEPTNKDTVSPNEKEYKDLPWDQIKNMWIYLSLSMIRFYREEGLHNKWQENSEMINGLFENFSPDQKSFFHYERTLYALFAFDLVKVREEINLWRINESLPFWEAKRAGLLAEIGEIEDAEKILERSLQNIRSKLNLRPITTDYSLVSQEAYTMLLLQYVKGSVTFKKNKWMEDESFRHELSERWNILKQYKCDPWNELKLFESRLESVPVSKPTISEKREFDIGRTTRTHHLGGTDQEPLSAYTFLRFCEETGIPFRIPGSTIGKKSAEGSLLRISKYSPNWALVTMIRIADEKAVDHIFNRESLHKLDVAYVDNIIKNYLEVIDQNWNDIESGNWFEVDYFGLVLARVIPEVLSRLCSKCSNVKREKMLHFLLDIYNSAQKEKFSGIYHLIKRLMVSFSNSQQYEIINKLLQFPVLTGLHHITEREFPNPFYFLRINKALTKNFKKPKIDREVIDNLFKKSLSSDNSQRKWAIFIIVKLYNLNLLEEKDNSKLSKVLWSQIDDLGFPSGTNFYKYDFLDLPHPEIIDPIALFNKYVQGSPFPIQTGKSKSGIPIRGGAVPICKELIGGNKFVQWEEEEVVSLLKRLIEWWDADKKFIKNEANPNFFSLIPEEFKGRFQHLIEVLIKVVMPLLSSESEKDIKDSIHRLLTEFEDFGLSAIRAGAASLHIFPENLKSLMAKLEDALISVSPEKVVDGLEAIFTILRNPQTRQYKFEISKLLNILGQKIKWRSTTGLVSALNTVSMMIRENSEFFTDELEASVLKGMSRLADETISETELTDLIFDKKLELRASTACLAFEIYQFYSNQNKKIPDEIQVWKNICRSENEFAEIRNEWIHIVD